MSEAGRKLPPFQLVSTNNILHSGAIGTCFLSVTEQGVTLYKDKLIVSRSNPERKRMVIGNWQIDQLKSWRQDGDRVFCFLTPPALMRKALDVSLNAFTHSGHRWDSRQDLDLLRAVAIISCE